MPWKTDESGNIAVIDGHPVWQYDDGKEAPFDAGSVLQRIGALTGESMARKNRIKELETRYAPFQEIQDPTDFLTKAQQAMEKVANFNDKDFVAIGEVEKVKAAVAESYKTKLAELEKGYKTQLEERETLIKTKDKGIHQLLVKGAFASSSFIREKTVLPPDVAFDSFGKFFQIEEIDGQPQAIAVRPNGEKIFSLREPGSYASADEAIEILVNERKDKDSLLRSSPGGSGATPNSGQNSKLNMTDLLKLDPIERINATRGVK